MLLLFTVFMVVLLFKLNKVTGKADYMPVSCPMSQHHAHWTPRKGTLTSAMLVPLLYYNETILSADAL